MAISGPEFVTALRKHLGAPYVYGAAGPAAFDCSGLIEYTLRSIGVKSVPRTSEAQWAWSDTRSVDYSDLQPGDLVFSDWSGDGASPGHVAVYSGHGKVIEAPRTGVPVHEIALNSSYRSHVKGYKRIKGATGGDVGAGGDTEAGIASGLSGIGEELANASKFVADLLMPQTWLRVAAFTIGAGALAAGLWLLLQEAGSHG